MAERTAKKTVDALGSAERSAGRLWKVAIAVAVAQAVFAAVQIALAFWK